MKTTFLMRKIRKNSLEKAAYVGKFAFYILFLVTAVSVQTSAASTSIPLFRNTCPNVVLNRKLPEYFHTNTQRKLDEKTYAMVVDMAQLPHGPSFPKNLVNNYDVERKKAYERLSKYKVEMSPEKKFELDLFEEESKSRSVFAVLTRNNPAISQPEFLGGGRAVIARGASQKLNFELDPVLDIQRDAKDGTAAEIGRLFLAPTENSAVAALRTKEMITLLLQALYNNAEVQTIYVHTSRAHVRLYRSMGLVTDKIIDRDKDNQLLVFNRTHLINFLQTGSTLGIAHGSAAHVNSNTH